MKTITLNFPREVQQSTEKDIRLVVAAVLFEKAGITAHEAAIFAGVSKRDFLSTMGRFMSRSKPSTPV